MKNFQIIQKYFTILGCSSSNQSNFKCLFNKRVLIGFTLLGYMIVSQFLYISNEANGFVAYMISIYQIFGYFLMLICFLTPVLKWNSICECIDTVEKLIDSRCKYPKSRKLFIKTDRQVERISEFIFVAIMKILLQCYVLPICIVSFGCYYLTDLGNDSFELPIPTWFPFDSYNPIGYLIAIAFEYVEICYACFVIACALSLGIGPFWFAISITKEIQDILHTINDAAQANQNNQSNDEMKTFLVEFIDTHAILRQVVHEFSDIFQPIIMSLFMWSLSAISITLLIIQMAIFQHGNSEPLFVMILDGTCVSVSVFIACEIGQRLTDAFYEISSTIDRFDWYLFPIEKQRMLPMIIAHAQQAIELECFGSITCTREIFRKIIHRAYSYFMVLRQFDG